MPLKEKFIVTHISPRNKRHALRATWGSTRARKQKQEWGGEHLLCFSGNTRQGRRNSLGLSNLDGGGGFWARRVGSTCLVLSPGWLRPRTLLLDCKSLTQEMAQSVGSGLIGSHMKGMLPHGPFAASDWTALGGQSHQPVRPPKMSKYEVFLTYD